MIRRLVHFALHQRFITLALARGPKHPAARRAPFGCWGTNVWGMLTQHRWTCMYCGTMGSVRRTDAAPRVPPGPAANADSQAIAAAGGRRDRSRIP